MNIRAGGNVGGAIVSGSQGTCRVRAGGSVAGTASNQVIESSAGIAEVRADSGDIRANLNALDGAIDVIDAPNGHIGLLPPAAVVHQISATNGINSLTSSGTIWPTSRQMEPLAHLTVDRTIGAR
jgi:hypothetical protein